MDGRLRVSHRRNDIDFLKGAGIFLVIVGHVSVPTIIRDIIYIFHMPLFFFLSGTLYREGVELPLKRVILKKAKSLLYPYFTLGGIVIIYNTIFDIIFNGGVLFTGKLIKRLVAWLYGNYIWENNYEYIGTLWFLCALFCVEIIFEMIYRTMQGNIKAMMPCVGCILIFGFLLSGCRFPFCMEVSFVALVFYFLGYMIKRCTAKHWLFPVIIFGIGMGLGLVNVYVSGEGMDMLDHQWGHPLLLVVSASLCCVGLYWMAECVNVIDNRMWLSFILSLGRNSLLIMVEHIYILFYVKKILSYIGIYNVWLIIFAVLIISWWMALWISRKCAWIYKHY